MIRPCLLADHGDNRRHKCEPIPSNGDTLIFFQARYCTTQKFPSQSTMMNYKLLISTLVALLSVSLTAVAFSVQDVSNSQRCEAGSVSRAQWLQTTGAVFTGIMLGTSTPAFAKDVDPAIKGTKKDPAFEACLSTCMYECTKPKGAEQKSRTECLPECKQKCATTKAQLMKGTPINKEE